MGKIYVECKAYRDTLSADIPKKLLGTVTLEGYSEGWLISTGEFGKDAKGFVEKWKEKPSPERERLSFFTPELIIESYINSKLIIDPDTINHEKLHELKNKTGSWTLLISTYGIFWIIECLENGLPSGIVAFYANDGSIVNETGLLSNLAKTDSSLKELDFLYGLRKSTAKQEDIKNSIDKIIVPVQQSESWDDYRPARPQDFVGRSDLQTNI